MQAQLFFHLISKTGCSFPVCCSSLPLKVMKKRLKLPVSIPQARGACLEKQDISTQRATRAGTGGQEKARLHAVRDITAATSSGKSTGFCLSQFSGCLKDPGLPISSLFWHIYIGSGSAQCGRWSPLGWAGETLPFPFYDFKCLKQLGAPWFNEASSNLTPKSLKTSLSTAASPIFTITWKPELFSSSPNDGCVYTSFRSYQDNQLSLVTWLRFN